MAPFEMYNSRRRNETEQFRLMFTIKSTRNNQVVQKQIEDSPNAVRTAIRFAFYNIGEDLVRIAKEEFNKPKSGRFYWTRVGKTGNPLKKPRRYQASAPGQAPAVVSGRLRRSLTHRPLSWNKMKFSAGDKEAFYAPFLEEGTSRMEARPFMSTAVKEVQKDAENYMKIEIKKQLSKP